MVALRRFVDHVVSPLLLATLLARPKLRKLGSRSDGLGGNKQLLLQNGR